MLARLLLLCCCCVLSARGESRALIANATDCDIRRANGTCFVDCSSRNITDLNFVDADSCGEIHLDLSYNSINRLNDNIFSKWIQLNMKMYISFRYNDISTIEDRAFNGIGNSVVYLDLSWNTLTNVSIWKDYLKNITDLDVAGNPLKRCDFRDLIFLKKLNVSFCNASSEDFWQFPDILTELDMSHCGLQNTQRIQFGPNLTIVNLSSNSLNELPHINFTTIKHLDMSNNKLQDIPFDFVDLIVSDNHTIILEGNQFSCDHGWVMTFCDSCNETLWNETDDKSLAFKCETFKNFSCHDELPADVCVHINEDLTATTDKLLLGRWVPDWERIHLGYGILGAVLVIAVVSMSFIAFRIYTHHPEEQGIWWQVR